MNSTGTAQQGPSWPLLARNDGTNSGFRRPGSMNFTYVSVRAGGSVVPDSASMLRGGSFALHSQIVTAGTQKCWILWPISGYLWRAAARAAAAAASFGWHRGRVMCSAGGIGAIFCPENDHPTTQCGTSRIMARCRSRFIALPAGTTESGNIITVQL